jgi:hypothetical protein
MHGATSHLCIGRARNGIVRINAIFKNSKHCASKECELDL